VHLAPTELYRNTLASTSSSAGEGSTGAFSELQTNLALSRDFATPLTSHVESHFGAGRHRGIGVGWVDGHASDRLAVARSLRQNVADAAGRPSARIVQLGRVHLRPQRPQLGLAHVPAHRPERFAFPTLVPQQPSLAPPTRHARARVLPVPRPSWGVNPPLAPLRCLPLGASPPASPEDYPEPRSSRIPESRGEQWHSRELSPPECSAYCRRAIRMRCENIASDAPFTCADSQTNPHSRESGGALTRSHLQSESA